MLKFDGEVVIIVVAIEIAIGMWVPTTCRHQIDSNFQSNQINFHKFGSARVFSTKFIFQFFNIELKLNWIQ